MNPTKNVGIMAKNSNQMPSCLQEQHQEKTIAVLKFAQKNCNLFKKYVIFAMRKIVTETQNQKYILNIKAVSSTSNGSKLLHFGDCFSQHRPFTNFLNF